MRAKEFQPNKPRNFVAKNATKGGAGPHKDKKKAEKQGDVKHKKNLVATEADQSAAPNIEDLKKRLAEIEAKKDQMELAVKKARNATRDIKYNDIPGQIVSAITVLANEVGVDERDLSYAVRQVTEKENELEQAIYELDDIFADMYRSLDGQASDLKWEIDDYETELRRSKESE
jgi:hypothetical protein